MYINELEPKLAIFMCNYFLILLNVFLTKETKGKHVKCALSTTYKPTYAYCDNVANINMLSK